MSNSYKITEIKNTKNIDKCHSTKNPFDNLYIKEDDFNYRGLCVTCSNSKRCNHQRDRAKPVLFCDEFYSRLKDREFSDKFQKTGSFIPIPQENYENNKGLCINCEKQGICTSQKPIWGVWHCEDYK
jgi:hypothetical protein